jgi:hypothetical protein
MHDMDLMEMNKETTSVALFSQNIQATSDFAGYEMLTAWARVNAGAIIVYHPAGLSGKGITKDLMQQLKRRGCGLGQGEALLCQV